MSEQSPLFDFASTIEEARKNEIVKALEERGATRPCSRCGNESFQLFDGYSMVLVNRNLNAALFIATDNFIPSIVVVCTNCGYLSQHSLGVLGLLPEETKIVKGRVGPVR